MNKFNVLSLVGVFCLTACTSVPPSLGITDGKLTPCPIKDNCVNSQSLDKKYTIEPIQYSGKPAAVKQDITKVLNLWSNAKTTVSEASYIRAEFSSQVFGFVDDVEFYFPDTQSAETTIHIRSASRVGYSDFGVNRERMEKVRSQLKDLNK